MFLSKICPQSRGTLAKLLSDNVSSPHRFFSAAVATSEQLSAEPRVLDKLYKKIEVEVRGNDPAVLESYGTFTCMAAKNLGINVLKHFKIDKPIHERLTVLKCVHIYKKHRVQYETRTYYRHIHLAHLTGSTADTFLEYIERNLPEGVAMKVTKVEIRAKPDSINAPSTI